MLTRWREMAPFNQDGDYIFASLDKHGQQPYWPNAAMEDNKRLKSLRELAPGDLGLVGAFVSTCFCCCPPTPV